MNPEELLRFALLHYHVVSASDCIVVYRRPDGTIGAMGTERVPEKVIEKLSTDESLFNE